MCKSQCRHLWSLLLSPLLLFFAHAEVSETPPISEVVGNELLPSLDIPGSLDNLEPPPDADQPSKLDLPAQSPSFDIMPEELEIAKTMLLQATETHRVEVRKIDTAKQSRRPPHVRGNETQQHTAAPVTVEEAPLELTLEDGLLQSQNKTQQNVSSASGVPDEAEYLHKRLADEEKFAVRLQQLLAQSSQGNSVKQQKFDVLEAQLRSLARSQQQVRDASMKEMAQDEAEVARQRSRADSAETRLTQATSDASKMQRTMQWLRSRVRTLLLHLTNVTHIGKAIELQLENAQHRTAAEDQKLETAHNHADLDRQIPVEMEDKLRTAQHEKASVEQRLTAVEHQNDFLQQRFNAVGNRDKVLRTENSLLRAKLTTKLQSEEQLRQELDRARDMLADTQKHNAQLQSQYADSLQGLVDASATSPSVIASSGFTMTASSSMNLKRDSHGLSTLTNISVVPVLTRKTIHDRRLLELSRDSQGLGAVLDGMYGAKQNS